MWLRRTLPITVLVVLLVLIPVPGTLGAPDLPGTGSCATVSAENYRVEATPDRRDYRIGKTANIHVKAVRKDLGSPVEGARAVVLIDWGHKKHALVGAVERTTDAQGEVTIPVRLKHKKLTPGRVKMIVYVFKVQVDSIVLCNAVMEYGLRTDKKAFRIRK